MQLFSGCLRPHRPGEWMAGSAILFIVTLAAKGSVTLAARAAGMSRKSAYALKKRDPLFAKRDPGQPRRPFPPRPAWHDRLLADLSSTRRDSPFGGKIPRLAPRPASR
jgi:hypothetical protein